MNDPLSGSPSANPAATHAVNRRLRKTRPNGRALAVLTTLATEARGISLDQRVGTSESISQSQRRLRDESLDEHLAQQAKDGGHHWTSLRRTEFRWLCQPA